MDKIYELKVYRIVNYAVAIVDILDTLIGFVFWRGI